MKAPLFAIVCAALVAFAAMPAPAAAQTPQTKTAKECRAEWQANKADNQAKGITEKAYVAQCRAGGTPSAVAPSAAPAPTATQKPATAPLPAPATTPGTTQAAIPQYRTEAEAKGQCSADTVVWVNTKSKVYHFVGAKDYGTTKHGAYMCEREATAQGNRAAKNEKHP